MIKGIPTIGPRGINFRSRLEAKYALLFEYLNWMWSFEPEDLKGYIPDFLLHFEKNRNLLVEIKGQLDLSFREAAEKLFHSGYSSDCIFFGSTSPRWNSETKLVNFCSRYVKPINHVYEYTKEAWSFNKETEVYYDKRKKRLWIVHENIGMGFCQDCVDYSLFESKNCIVCGNKESLIFKKELKLIEDAWSHFCNQTQWKKKHNNIKKQLQEIEIKSMFSLPKKIKEDGDYIPENSNPFHALSKEDFLMSLLKQMNAKGEAYFCENGINWQQSCDLLEDLQAVYITSKEGLCCNMNYIAIESCNMHKLNLFL